MISGGLLAPRRPVEEQTLAAEVEDKLMVRNQDDQVAIFTESAAGTMVVPTTAYLWPHVRATHQVFVYAL